MCLDLGAKAVARPEPGATPVVETIARTLETDLVVQCKKVEAVVGEPGLEMRLLGSAFERHEMTRDCLVTIDDTGICREDHVGVAQAAVPS